MKSLADASEETPTIARTITTTLKFLIALPPLNKLK